MDEAVELYSTVGIEQATRSGRIFEAENIVNIVGPCNTSILDSG